jgi:long-chain acyl-CoA synthetase
MYVTMKYSPSTIPALVDQGIPKNTTDVFISTKRDGKWHAISPAEFKEKVKNFALGLYDLGIRKGDKVALHSENGNEWLIADQAILSIGAINVPIYTTQPGDQIYYILENSEAKIYLYSTEKLASSFRPFASKIKGLQMISLVSSTDKNDLTLDQILEKGKALAEAKPKLFDELKAAVKPDDLASFIYTSGTTGLPKGVMLTHDNIASNVQYSVGRIPFDIEGCRGGKLLSYLPLSHIFERMLGYMYFYIGYPVYYIEQVDHIKEDLQTIKPIFFATVPRLLEKIYSGLRDKIKKESGLKQKIGMWAIKQADAYSIDSPPIGIQAIKLKMADKLVFSKIREGLGGNLLGMISGGAALAPHLMNFFTALGLRCHQGYGLTETSPVLTVTTDGAIKAGSSGRVLECVELKIAEDGEILAKGPNIMKGYYKNPEATAEVLSDDGWFSTGDVGHLDDEGFLFITDRKKDIFKLSTGKYVAPQHVENTLLNSALIEQVVVLGAKQKFCSALIVPNKDAVDAALKEAGYSGNSESEDYSNQVEKLIKKEVDRMNETLPKWERIKKFALLDSLFSIESGELTPTLKTKRKVIKEKFIAIIESIYKEENH